MDDCGGGSRGHVHLTIEMRVVSDALTEDLDDFVPESSVVLILRVIGSDPIQFTSKLRIVTHTAHVPVDECKVCLSSEKGITACLMHRTDPLNLKSVRQGTQTSIEALDSRHHELNATS